jgi:hypothetical protein
MPFPDTKVRVVHCKTGFSTPRGEVDQILTFESHLNLKAFRISCINNFSKGSPEERRSIYTSSPRRRNNQSSPLPRDLRNLPSILRLLHSDYNVRRVGEFVLDTPKVRPSESREPPSSFPLRGTLYDGGACCGWTTASATEGAMIGDGHEQGRTRRPASVRVRSAVMPPSRAPIAKERLHVEVGWAEPSAEDEAM